MATDLVFNVIDWHVSDLRREEDEDDDVPAYVMKLFGRTSEGVSVALECTDYTPHFYVRSEAIPELNARQLKALEQLLQARFKEGFAGVKTLRKKDFWGFHHEDTFQYVQLLFRSEGAMRQAANMFARPLVVKGLFSDKPARFSVYESNIPAFLRFCHKRRVDPCGWVRVQAGRYVARPQLKASSQIDVTARWASVEGVEMDAIAPFVVASFDIECVPSFDDEFPTAVRDWRKLALRFSAADPSTSAAAFFQELFDSGAIRPKAAVDQSGLRSAIRACAGDLDDIRAGALGYATAAGRLQPLLVPRGQGDPAIVGDLAKRMASGLPALQGDPCIMIGTTVHKYGERVASQRHVHVLGSCDAIPGASVTCYETERDMLLGWTRFVQRQDPDVFLSWNGFGFDFQYVHDRATELGCVYDFCQLGRIVGKACELKTKMLSSSALGDNVMRLIEMEGRVNIDLMKVVQRDHKLDSYKLDNVAQHFTGQKKNDVSPHEIFRLYRGSAADRRVVAEYCIQDCALLNALCVKLEIMANNIGMANVCCVPLNFIFMRGQGIKIFSLVSKQCKDDDFMMPVVRAAASGPFAASEEEEEGYEGAIVLTPTPGMYLDEPITVLDYASLYPSSMISENISHDTLVLDPKYDNLPGVEYVDVTYDAKGKAATGAEAGEVTRTCRYAQSVKGVLPRILQTLLSQRKTTRKKMEGQADEFKRAVLDGLQLAYKVTANSLYGQVGARTSPIYLKDLAASTTAVGRSMILKAKKFIDEECPDATTVYGDSVAGYSPVLVRIGRRTAVYESIDSLAALYGDRRGWRAVDRSGAADRSGKESCELLGVEAWTERGWTALHRVIRHRLAPHKRMVRVVTGAGLVDVTDDHSLLRPDADPVSPRDLKLGDELLHHPPPPDLFGAAVLSCTLCIPERGWYQSQLAAATAFALGVAMGCHMSVDLEGRVCRDAPGQVRADGRVRALVDIEWDGDYVYDLTTENHHFAAGVGTMIVHNTDSIFCKVSNVDPVDGRVLSGTELVERAMSFGHDVSARFQPLLKAPHCLEFDKVLHPFVIISKKRYIGMQFEDDPAKGKMKAMGIVLKRRDNAPVVKSVYGGAIDILLKERNILKATAFVCDSLQKLIAGQYGLEALTISKALRSEYADPTRIAHKVLAERVKARDPGNAFQSNDRVPYVFIKIQEEKGAKYLQGDRIETPDYIRANDLAVDYNQYLSHQLEAPLIQLFGIVVEQLPGYSLEPDHWARVEAKLSSGDKPLAGEKLSDKIVSLREAEVKRIMFDPILREIGAHIVKKVDVLAEKKPVKVAAKPRTKKTKVDA